MRNTRRLTHLIQKFDVFALHFDYRKTDEHGVMYGICLLCGTRKTPLNMLRHLRFRSSLRDSRHKGLLDRISEFSSGQK